MIQNSILTQKPMSAQGLTGVQVVKFIPGARIYMKAPDSLTAAPITSYMTKLGGAVPASFTDLGTVDGDAKVTYTKTRKDVTTGIIKTLRDSYIEERKFMIEFALTQNDDVALAALTGLTPSVIQSGSIVNFAVGQETVVKKAIIVVYSDVLTGKEMQLYHPAALTDYTYDSTADGMMLKVTTEFTLFTASGDSSERIVSKTIYA